MADIVGLVASILQLVDTIKKARDYVHTFRDAQKQRKLLLMEIESLEPLLRELDGRIQRSQGGDITAEIQNFEEPLLQFREIVERLAKELDQGSGFISRVTWSLWGKGDVEEELDTVRRFQASLTVWLEMDIWDLAQDTLATTKDAAEEQRIDHKYIFKSVRAIARNQEQHLTGTKRDTIIEWYSPLNFFVRQADIFRLHQPGTGQWFLEMDSFRKWKCEYSKVLWCRGIPGAGKTVLASIVVDHLRADHGHCDNIGVAAIYLNHKETDAHTPSTLLASLWRQLVVGQSIASVEELYHKHREPGTKPSLDDAHAILCSTLSQYSKVFILVDALDEYPERERGILMSYLSRLGSNVNLMLTARPHIGLDNSTDMAQVTAMEIRATAEDIRCYMDAQILASPRLSKHVQTCPELRKQIEERIVSQSHGMFLMAKLHVDSLTGKHSVKAVQDTLKNLAHDLDSTYDQVMQRIHQQSEDDMNLALRTLSWVSHAKRLLRPSELRVALAVEPETSELDPNNLIDVDIILFVCAGLLVVDARDNRLRLVHFTAQDYLERKRAKLFPDAPTQITMTCLQYLSYDIFQQEMDNPLNLFHKHSFLDYAVEYCLRHARGRPESDIMPSIVFFLGATQTGWWALWNWKHRYHKGSTPDSPLLIAALFGLEKICRHLIKTAGPGDALQLAIMAGHIDVVRFLISNGVDVRGTEGAFDSALHAAACHGRADIIALLLAHHADIDYRGPSGTALQWAARFGHKKCIEVLIAHGPDINAPGGYFGSALYAAATSSSSEIFRRIVAAGADIGIGLKMSEVLEDMEAAMALVLEKGFQGESKMAPREPNELPLRDLPPRQGGVERSWYAMAVSEPFAQGARQVLSLKMAHRPPNTLPSHLEKCEINHSTVNGPNSPPPPSVLSLEMAPRPLNILPSHLGKYEINHSTVKEPYSPPPSPDFDF
ncbi:Ankyrin repeat domain containing protein [Mycena sanguinolenta]|uniref:Ankyrin repeat domain containing protein n=1 Tax=Mycena sanguinolenta TaxID=230812 RepID=A0A8H7DFT6_9AGAR|nr:Ankyrin repeat domain containing protein [Mycena sanguinolenta]